VPTFIIIIVAEAKKMPFPKKRAHIFLDSSGDDDDYDNDKDIKVSKDDDTNIYNGSDTDSDDSCFDFGRTKKETTTNKKTPPIVFSPPESELFDDDDDDDLQLNRMQTQEPRSPLNNITSSSSSPKKRKRQSMQELDSLVTISKNVALSDQSSSKYSPPLEFKQATTLLDEKNIPADSIIPEAIKAVQQPIEEKKQINKQPKSSLKSVTVIVNGDSHNKPIVFHSGDDNLDVNPSVSIEKKLDHSDYHAPKQDDGKQDKSNVTSSTVEQKRKKKKKDGGAERLKPKTKKKKKQEEAKKSKNDKPTLNTHNSASLSSSTSKRTTITNESVSSSSISSLTTPTSTTTLSTSTATTATTATSTSEPLQSSSTLKAPTEASKPFKAPLAATNKSATPSNPTKKKKKQTFQQQVLSHLLTTIRPFTLKSLASELRTTSVALNHLMLSMIDKGIVKKRDWGKNKNKELYYIDLEIATRELHGKDHKFDPKIKEAATTELKHLTNREMSVYKQMEMMNTHISNQELEQQLHLEETVVSDMRNRVNGAKERISTLNRKQDQNNGNRLSKHSRLGGIQSQVNRPIKSTSQMKKDFNKMRIEWKNRKEKCMDFLDNLSDAMEKKPKDVIKMLELETDEAMGVKLPPKVDV
jgi:predicted transcriptional regulator